jgi:hypothetical protein
MALKLRRRTRRFTNESLSPRSSWWQLGSLRTGADSFKRVLGGVPSSVGRVRPNLVLTRNEPKDPHGTFAMIYILVQQEELLASCTADRIHFDESTPARLA